MNVMDAIRTRRSVRDYDPKPIPEAVMALMKDALRLAPSACNFQPWKFVIVTDAALKEKLAGAAHGQRFIAAASVVVVGIGFPDQAYKHMGGYGNAADVDVAIALDHLTLAAAAEGLGTCWIGAFDERAVKALLNIPRKAKVVALTPLGYPAEPALIHPVEAAKRKAPEEVFCHEKFC